MAEVKIGAGQGSDWPSTALPTLVIPLKRDLTVTARALLGTSGIEGNAPKLKLGSQDGAKVLVEVLDGTQLYVGAANSPKLRPVQTKIEVPLGAWLHTGPAETPHRVLQFIKA